VGSVVERRVGVVKHWQFNEGNSLTVCIIGWMLLCKTNTHWLLEDAGNSDDT